MKRQNLTYSLRDATYWDTAAYNIQSAIFDADYQNKTNFIFLIDEASVLSKTLLTEYEDAFGALYKMNHTDVLPIANKIPTFIPMTEALYWKTQCGIKTTQYAEIHHTKLMPAAEMIYSTNEKYNSGIAITEITQNQIGVVDIDEMRCYYLPDDFIPYNENITAVNHIVADGGIDLITYITNNHQEERLNQRSPKILLRGYYTKYFRKMLNLATNIIFFTGEKNNFTEKYFTNTTEYALKTKEKTKIPCSIVYKIGSIYRDRTRLTDWLLQEQKHNRRTFLVFTLQEQWISYYNEIQKYDNKTEEIKKKLYAVFFGKLEDKGVDNKHFLPYEIDTENNSTHKTYITYLNSNYTRGINCFRNVDNIIINLCDFRPLYSVDIFTGMTNDEIKKEYSRRSANDIKQAIGRITRRDSIIKEKTLLLGISDKEIYKSIIEKLKNDEIINITSTKELNENATTMPHSEQGKRDALLKKMKEYKAEGKTWGEYYKNISKSLNKYFTPEEINSLKQGY